jgi:hypothetical protein
MVMLLVTLLQLLLVLYMKWSGIKALRDWNGAISALLKKNMRNQLL